MYNDVMDQTEPQEGQPEEKTAEVKPLPLSRLAQLVIETFEKEQQSNHEHKITVNPFVSKVATAYEKLRNAMEYREDEVVLRATIERILRRRLLLGGTAKTTAEPLVRELIWARYLPDNYVPESAIKKVEEVIDLYLQLRLGVLEKHSIKLGQINEWTYHLMSCAIEHVLNPNHEKETVANFMYQVLQDDVTIVDDTEETRNAQVYLAVRRAFARDDLAFLRFHLFKLYFGPLTQSNLNQVTENFLEGFKEINQQLQHPRKDKIYNYVKKRTAAFFIFEDVLRLHKGKLRDLFADESLFHKAVVDACNARYEGIATKVRRAIVRSVIFILMSKVLFAFLVEGTYERIVYGRILWTSIIINTSIPPLLMVIVGFFIRVPGDANTKRIYEYNRILLTEEKPRLGSPLTVKREQDKPDLLFDLLWVSAFVLSFGSIIFILTKLDFNPISQFIFIFFLTIVSFLAYRISLTATLYTVGEKQSFVTPFIDFLFLPIIRVGSKLTHSISSVNFFLFLFDLFIETPFKVFFAFIERWFKFLHEKSEDLG